MHERKETACRIVLFFLGIYFFLIAVSSALAEPNIVEGKHLFRHYCAVCHGFSGKGNGINADSLGDVHPTDLTTSEFDKYDDEEIYEVIDGGGAAVDISYYMPPWGGVFTEDQINNIVAYVRTLSEALGSPEAEAVRLSDLKKEGKEKCLLCHAKETNLLRPIAPNIGHEGSKLRRDWLFKFLKQPERLRPIGFTPFTKAIMPQFFFTDEEVEALVAYLMTLKDEGVKSDVLMGFDPSDPAEIEKGQILFEEDYACDGCHKRSVGGEGGIVGPELSYAVERIRPEWLFYWIKKPQAVRPDTPMPNFRMPDDEIRAVIAYLLSLNKNVSNTMTVADSTARPEQIEKGKKMVQAKNCGGCHMIDSFNSQLGDHEESGIMDEMSDEVK